MAYLYDEIGRAVGLPEVLGEQSALPRVAAVDLARARILEAAGYRR